MKRDANKLALVLLSLALCCSISRTQSKAQDGQFQGWPEGWVNAYQRFERFIAARRASWPRANIEISDDGTIAHGVRIARSDREGVSYRFFKRGRNVLTSGEIENLMTDGRDDVLTPGICTVALYTYGPVGFQHLYPIVWFQVEKVPGNAMGDGGSVHPFRIRVLPASFDAETRWPNERLLLFLDFDIFPHGDRSEIEKKNRKVQPAVLLHLDNRGVIEREKLDDEAVERLLRWRIYRDGELVEKGSAAGVTHRETRFGPGNYQVLAGVEGPSGFMPVSNILEFPLFPDGAGKEVVIPPDKNRDGVPDFVEALEKQQKLQLSNNAAGDLDNDGLPDSEEHRGPVAKPTDSADEMATRLIELWRSWEYDLKNRPPVPAPSGGSEQPAAGTRPCNFDTDGDGASDQDDPWPNTRLIGIRSRRSDRFPAMTLETFMTGAS